MKRQRYVWVVEMLMGAQWKPTVGSALVQADARIVLRHWRERNPQDQFRLQRYYRGKE